MPPKVAPSGKIPAAAALTCVSAAAATGIDDSGAAAKTVASAKTSAILFIVMPRSPLSLLRGMPLHVPLLHGLVDQEEPRLGPRRRHQHRGIASAPKAQGVLALIGLVLVVPLHRVLEIRRLCIGEAEPHRVVDLIDQKDVVDLAVQVQPDSVVVEVALGCRGVAGRAACVAAEVR